METFLTTKQVQDLFKIDRITVYRMLQDGRLKGVKIGNQWRFPQREVDRLLSGVPAESAPASARAESVFPIHCVQTIQDLFTSVSQCSAVIIDQNGERVTKISQPGPLCTLLLSTPTGAEACAASWRAFAERASGREEIFTCHSGLTYFGSVIFNQNKKQGVFLAGEFYLEETDMAEEMDRLKKFAQIHDINEGKLLEASRQVPHLTQTQQKHLIKQPAAAAAAVESILNERTAFIGRLQQIAHLTQEL